MATFQDLPMYRDSDGELHKKRQNEALLQAILIWATSGKGEKIRSTTGGVVYKHLGALMSDETAQSIKQDITYGLEHEFEPNLTVVYCNVTPVYKEQLYKIDIVAYNEEHNLGVDYSFKVSNRV